MKKALSAVVIMVFAAMLTGCGKGSAKNVATTWLNDFYHMDYAAAKPLSTESTRTFLEQIEQLSSMVSDSSKTEMKKITVTVKDVKEAGDTAVATYTVSDEAGKDQSIKLLKQNGKWLVEFSKEDSQNANDAGPDSTPGTDSTAGPATPTDSGAHDTATNKD